MSECVCESEWRCSRNWRKSRRHYHRMPSKWYVPTSTSTMDDGSPRVREINAAMYSHRINRNQTINWNWSNKNAGAWDAPKGMPFYFYRSNHKKGTQIADKMNKKKEISIFYWCAPFFLSMFYCFIGHKKKPRTQNINKKHVVYQLYFISIKNIYHSYN